MPGADESQGRVSWSQSTSVDDSGQAAVGDENIAGNQITMVHHVTGRAARKLPQVAPHPAKPRNIQKLVTVLEARLHPRVVGTQAASPPAAGERSASRVDCAHTMDELGQIKCKRS